MEEGACGDVVSDPPDSFLLCISESWDKLKKQLTVGLVVSMMSTDSLKLRMHSGNSLIRLFSFKQINIDSLVYLKVKERLYLNLFVNTR